MFFNREKEIKTIKDVINKKNTGTSCILVYGRRRVGKSTLVRESLKDYDGIYIEFECAESLFDSNMKRLASLTANTLNMPFMSSIQDPLSLLSAIDNQGKDVVLFIDEYQYLKKGYKEGNLDSIFQIAIDSLSNRLTIILCGSYVSMMQELTYSSSPLFGRFSALLHIQPFDYLESATFYEELSIREKIEFYSVFGGMPFAIEKIDKEKSLKENINDLLLNPTASLFIVITETLLKEIFKIEQAEAILSTIGNGKKRNIEISSALNISAIKVSQETKRLIEMDIIKKNVPINHRDDSKKTFYEINDNLLRFFYTFIYPNISELKRFGSDFIWKRYIENKIDTFISKRFEGIIAEYLEKSLKENVDINFSDIGTYWYDDKINKKNGEFDCAIKQSNGYFIIEAKHLKNPMTSELINDEIEKMQNIPDLPISGYGFASSSGFEEEINCFLITGDDIYSKEEIKKGIKLRKALGTI